jgi:CheY-like chemotaxis protein
MTCVRVLHVDDEPDIREIVELSLGLDPVFTIKSCAEGSDALAIAPDWRPDLILLDVIMPEMDGPMTFARLRARESTAHVPVVFMTARAQMSERERLMSLGAAGVICKPFDPMTLAPLVRCYMPAAQTRMTNLANAFLMRSRGDAAVLAELRARLAKANSLAVLDRIEAIARGLAEGAGIYGFHRLGAAAAALTAAVAARICGADSGDVEAAVEELMAGIDEAAARKADA